MAKILTSTTPHFFDILKTLHKQAHEIYTIQPQFAKTLQDMDIPAASLNQAAPLTLQRKALNDAASLIHRVKMPRKGDFTKTAHAFMRENVRGFLMPRLLDLSGFINTLQMVQPDLILLHNDVEPLLRAAALWGRVRAVPVLHVPHAVYLDIEKGAVGADIHDLVTATYLAAGGVFQGEWYKRRGMDQVFYTGLPQFDKLMRFTQNQAESRRLLKLHPKKPVVTYASSWRQDTNLLGCHDEIEQVYQAMLEVVKTTPHIQFIIKLHPRDAKAKWHVETAKQVGAQCLITQTHLPVVLKASDVVCCYSGSNILFESAMLSSARLLATRGFEDDPEVGGMPTEPVPDPAKLKSAILTALQAPTPDYSAFLHKYIGVHDGQASPRIVAVIEKLVEDVHASI
jgi:UDP-N-acetylglucosamine 2-epimerase